MFVVPSCLRISEDYGVMKKTTQISPLLCEKWIEIKPGIIRGSYWEDNSDYEIQCPACLARILIELQHNLFNLFHEQEACEKQATRIKNIFDSIGAKAT